MSLIRPLSSMRNEMDRLFSEMERDLMIPLGAKGHGDMLTPALDISEDEKNVNITAMVPGIKPENIEVEVTDTQLMLSGEIKQEKENNLKNYHRREIVHGQFRRQVTLPVEVDSNQAKANFENGLLHITIPKSQSSKRHRIPINK